MVINAVVAVWAAPAVSAPTLRKTPTRFVSKRWGKRWVSCGLYSVCGRWGMYYCRSQIHYGADTWNVLDIVQRWDSLLPRSLRYWLF